MIVAVPLPTAVTVNGALEEPAAIVRGVCTVATAVLLLVKATLAPPAGAAAASVTVPWAVEPATMVAVLSVTLVMLAVLLGVVGEEEPEQ